MWDAAAERDARADADVDGVPGEGAADAGASVDDEALVRRVVSSADAEERAGAAAAFAVAPVRGVVELRLVAISDLLVHLAQATASSGGTSDVAAPSASRSCTSM